VEKCGCLHRATAVDSHLSRRFVSGAFGGTIMTSKSLFLGVVVLCTLPAAGLAQTTATLISEDFDELTPANGVTGPVGVFSSLAPGTVNILGPMSGLCFALASGNCVELGRANPNGGVLESNPLLLQPGDSYSLSFVMNGQLSGGHTNGTVSVGSFSQNLNAVTHSSTAETFSITVPAATSVPLIFTGVSGNNGLVLDDIRLTCSGPTCSPAVPEPATLGLLALGLLGAGFAGRKRRN